MLRRLFKELAQDAAPLIMISLASLILWVGFCAPRPELAVTLEPMIVSPAFMDIIEAVEQERHDSIAALSFRYGIDTVLARRIHDIALAEGLSADLGARLVRVESFYRPEVISFAGAVGLTQVLPSTAYELDPTLRYEDLFDEETNLHLGFRYLRRLLDEYDGDLGRALLSYNRGPNRVTRLLASNIDPRNGYAASVCGGPC